MTYFNEFVSDGCSGVPDLWNGACCKMHDFAAHASGGEYLADWPFLFCTVGLAAIVAVGFGVCYWLGMLIFRPLWYRFRKPSWKKAIHSKSDDIEY